MEKDEKELEKKVAKRKKVNEPVETKEVQIIKNNNTPNPQSPIPNLILYNYFKI